MSPENVAEAMGRSKSRWDAVTKFIQAVLTKKEADERAIQAAV